MNLSDEQRHEYAVYLGQQPKKKVERECMVCGQHFAGTRRARYCSRTCESRAYRARRAAALGVEPEGGA